MFRHLFKQSILKLTSPIFAFFKKTVESNNVESLLSAKNFSCKTWASFEKARFLIEKKKQYKLQLMDCHQPYVLNQQISNARGFPLEESGKEGFYSLNKQ